MNLRKFVILIFAMVSEVYAATDKENIDTCLSGKYHSLCNYGALTPEQRARAVEARRLENLETCLSGKYPSLCVKSLLSQSELKQVLEAERLENLDVCLSGKYKSLCKHGLLSQSELQKVKAVEKRENLDVCMSGTYASLCDHSLLTPNERVEVSQAEKSAEERLKELKKYAPAVPTKPAYNGYLIEVAHNDELFIINGEKFEAQTYCLGWDEGDTVKFIEGSPFGACASAKLYNFNRDEICDVWCE